MPLKVTEILTCTLQSAVNVEDKGKGLIEKLKPYMLELEALKEDIKPKMPKRQLQQLRAVPQ